MSVPTKFEDAEIQRRIKELPGWQYKNGRLHRDYRFENFVQAFRFMTECARHAEKLGHHPDWRNLYGWITVDLSTHLANGVTELDFSLARAMNESAKQVESA
jgi:4a-hydroxytetrahydrobiopterin dehydratase